MDEELDSKNKLVQRKNQLPKTVARCREFFTDMPQDMRDVLKEKCSMSFEILSNDGMIDLLLEHQTCRQSRTNCRPWRTKKAAVPEGFGQMGWRQ